MNNKLVRVVSAVGVAMFLAGSVVAADFPDNQDIVELESDVQAGTKIGVLRCTKQPGFGYVIGSAKNLDCVFTHFNDGARAEYYTGQIVKVGADLGYTDESKLVWGVYAPSTDVHGQKLDGTYVGVQAEANVIVGGGINVLSGSFNNSYNLIPISVSGSTGLNVAGGLGAITLSSIE